MVLVWNPFPPRPSPLFIFIFILLFCFCCFAVPCCYFVNFVISSVVSFCCGFDLGVVVCEARLFHVIITFDHDRCKEYPSLIPSKCVLKNVGGYSF